MKSVTREIEENWEDGVRKAMGRKFQEGWWLLIREKQDWNKQYPLDSITWRSLVILAGPVSGESWISCGMKDKARRKWSDAWVEDLKKIASIDNSF